MWPDTTSGATLTIWASTNAYSVSERDRREPIQPKTRTTMPNAMVKAVPIHSLRRGSRGGAGGECFSEDGVREGFFASGGGTGSEGDIVMVANRFKLPIDLSRPALSQTSRHFKNTSVKPAGCNDLLAPAMTFLAGSLSE